MKIYCIITNEFEKKVYVKMFDNTTDLIRSFNDSCASAQLKEMFEKRVDAIERALWIESYCPGWKYVSEWIGPYEAKAEDITEDCTEDNLTSIKCETQLNRMWIYATKESEDLGEASHENGFVISNEFLNKAFEKLFSKKYSSLADFLETYVPEEDGEELYKYAIDSNEVITEGICRVDEMLLDINSNK